VSDAPAARTFEVRHLQLARAAFAAIAAVMITFSPDHSAAVGLAVFSGFAIATGLVFLVAVWVVHPAGSRWPSVLMGIATILAGMASGIPAIRTTELFFVVVIAWALVAGVIELVAGLRQRAALRQREDLTWRRETADTITIGAVTLLTGTAILAVPTQYALRYYIDEAQQSFTLTGITIAVGLFGVYAAIVAVYLGIAGFSPRKAMQVEAPAPEPTTEDAA
jgi:uncharacterized membrane protein HdeD (DUF308 family)